MYLVSLMELVTLDGTNFFFNLALLLINNKFQVQLGLSLSHLGFPKANDSFKLFKFVFFLLYIQNLKLVCA